MSSIGPTTCQQPLQLPGWVRFYVIIWKVGRYKNNLPLATPPPDVIIITLGLFERSLLSTIANSAPSHNSPSPLTVRVNQALDISFAQVIQNIPRANLRYRNCCRVSHLGLASKASAVRHKSCRPNSDPV